MEKRFDQLRSFLKDPQAYPHPDITLDSLVHVETGILRALRVAEFRQKALDVMELGMFHKGLLKGNMRTSDIAIKSLEDFILEAAAAFYLAKKQLSGSLWVYYLDPDGGPQVIEHTLITAHDNMMDAFEQFREIVLNPPPPVIKGPNLIRPDKMLRICDELYSLLSESLNNVKEETSFDLITELIPIFLKHIPKAPDNLIATHIFELVRGRQDSPLRGIDLPSTDVLRKRVKKARERITSTIQ